MKPVSCLRYNIFAAVSGLLLTACAFKPVKDSTRHFVLTPIPADQPALAPTRPVSIGIRFVTMPSQLLRDSISVRIGTNEIEYLENAQWAERLDHCFERTMAANLSRLLPSDSIYLDDWGRDQVGLKVSVDVQQFEVDIRGTGTLVAQWRITDPGSDQPPRSGLARLVRKGESPHDKPEAIAATLSDLTAHFSRDLAQAIRESVKSDAVSSSSPTPN
jgi:uncharacterized lipoprotein YmbA